MYLISPVVGLVLLPKIPEIQVDEENDETDGVLDDRNSFDVGSCFVEGLVKETLFLRLTNDEVVAVQAVVVPAVVGDAVVAVFAVDLLLLVDDVGDDVVVV